MNKPPFNGVLLPKDVQQYFIWSTSEEQLYQYIWVTRALNVVA